MKHITCDSCSLRFPIEPVILEEPHFIRTCNHVACGLCVQEAKSVEGGELLVLCPVCGQGVYPCDISRLYFTSDRSAADDDLFDEIICDERVRAAMKLEETTSQQQQNMQTALDLQNDQLQANSKLIDVALAQIEVAKEYQASVQKRLNDLKSRLCTWEGIRAGLEARLANIKSKSMSQDRGGHVSSGTRDA